MPGRFPLRLPAAAKVLTRSPHRFRCLALFPGIALLLLIVSGCGAVKPVETLEAEEEVVDEIESLLRAQLAAWNNGDLEGFTSVYDETCIFLSPSGLTRGRAEVLARYQRNYPDRATMGSLDFEFIEMVPMSMEVASLLGLITSEGIAGVTVAAHWRITRTEGEDSSGLTLIVFRRTAEGWRIIQDASM